MKYFTYLTCLVGFLCVFGLVVHKFAENEEKRIQRIVPIDGPHACS